MEYWRGLMNWPIDSKWKCEICEKYEGLTWGLVHAQCRCNVCHTQYGMRDKDGKVVTFPICQLKPEYHKAFKIIWDKDFIPEDEVTDEQWSCGLRS